MLWASKNAPWRPDYRYEKAPGGGYIAFAATSRPYIKARHIDGPLLVMRNGEMHWLTWRERLLLWLGKTDALALERKYRPHLAE
jgi:hypothetical protein